MDMTVSLASCTKVIARARRMKGGNSKTWPHQKPNCIPKTTSIELWQGKRMGQSPVANPVYKTDD